MFSFRILSIFLLLGLLAVGKVSAKEYTHALTIYPPYFNSEDMIEEHGPGVARVMMDKLYAHAGLKVIWKAMPYARVVEAIQKGTVDLANVAESPDLDKIVFLPTPPVDIIVNSYSRLDTSILPKTLEELKDKSVVIVRNWPLMNMEGIKDPASGVKVRTVNTPSQAIKMLIGKRVDHMVILQDPIDELDSTLTSQVKSEQLYVVKGYYTAVVKTGSDSDQLNKKIKAAYDELVSKGKIYMENGKMKFRD